MPSHMHDQHVLRLERLPLLRSLAARPLAHKRRRRRAMRCGARLLTCRRVNVLLVDVLHEAFERREIAHGTLAPAAHRLEDALLIVGARAVVRVVVANERRRRGALRWFAPHRIRIGRMCGDAVLQIGGCRLGECACARLMGEEGWGDDARFDCLGKYFFLQF